MAYRSFGGEVEASSTPTICRLPDSRRHQLSAIALRSKGCLSNRTALAMVFKLLEGAQKSWRRLDGHNQLSKLVLGVTFNDGIEVIAKADRPSAHNRRRLTGPAVTKNWR